MPTVIKVPLAERAYEVKYLESISAIARQLPAGKGKDFALIDAAVDRLYGKEFRAALPAVAFIRIPSGEGSKSFSSLEKLADELVHSGATRQTRLIAIGGGVVGDLTGFLAGVFMRGVDFFQVPTTLLAMVDSSVGGKTAVNLKTGKNLVGVFHQPRAVYVLPQLLKTLPVRELRCGLAESVKTALIANPKLVAAMEKHSYSEKVRDIDFLSYLSSECIKIKADIVAKDEKETSIRAFLNFGHTLAHAIETRVAYKGVLHGEAVAVGMRFATLVSRRLGYLTKENEGRISGLLRQYSLPAALSELKTGKAAAFWKAPELVKLMRADKKNQAGSIRFVLLDAIGKARLPEGVAEQELLASLKEFQTIV